ncbi:hypothetical protein FGB62_454g03 [Gracilaria domingensis]|nr:hypothetical protein FGB62_454g03 [Gracilaria domingensis]
MKPLSIASNSILMKMKKKKNKILKTKKNSELHSKYISEVKHVLNHFVVPHIGYNDDEESHQSEEKSEVSHATQQSSCKGKAERRNFLRPEAQKISFCDETGSQKVVKKIKKGMKRSLKLKSKKKGKIMSSRSNMASALDWYRKWNPKQKVDPNETCSTDLKAASLLLQLRDAPPPRPKFSALDFNFLFLFARFGELRGRFGGWKLRENGSFSAEKAWIFYSFRRMCEEWNFQSIGDVLRKYAALGVKANLPHNDISLKLRSIKRKYTDYNKFLKAENEAYNDERMSCWDAIGRFIVDEMRHLSCTELASKFMLRWSNNSCGLDCFLFQVPNAVRMLLKKSVCDLTALSTKCIASILVAALHIGHHGWHGSELDPLNVSNWTRILSLDCYEYVTKKKIPNSFLWSPSNSRQGFLDMSDIMTVLFPAIFNDGFVNTQPDLPFRTLSHVVPTSDLEESDRQCVGGWTWLLQNTIQGSDSNIHPGIRILVFPLQIENHQLFIKTWIDTKTTFQATRGNSVIELSVLSWMGFKNEHRDHFVAFSTAPDQETPVVSYYDGMRNNGRPILLHADQIGSCRAPFYPPGSHAVALISTIA